MKNDDRYSFLRNIDKEGSVCTFLTLSLTVDFGDLGLTQPILLFYMIDRQPTNITEVFHKTGWYLMKNLLFSVSYSASIGPSALSSDAETKERTEEFAKGG